MNKEERELYEVRLELNRLREELKKSETMIKFHNYIFSNIGLDISLINQFEEKIEDYRIKNQDVLNSDNEFKREQAVTEFQDVISEMATELVCGNVGINIKRYESILKEEFGNSWKLLDEKSKSFLITAKVTFESIRFNDDEDNLDYSGVCLLVTKALEVELHKVFFKEYIEYLNQRKISIFRYPDVLLSDNKNNVKEDYLFNMGLIVPIMGLRRIEDYNVTKGNDYCFRYYTKYAQDMLYDSTENNTIKESLINARFVEKVRRDYRNPSAHTGRLTKIICNECLDYIVDTEKQLKRMLQNMTKRNKRII